MGNALSQRPRWFAAAIIAVSSIVIAHYVQVWAVVPASLAPTSDFAGTYVAATLIRDGHAEQIYDTAAERRTLVESGAPTGHDNIPFENPPSAAVVAVPFTLLNAGAAWRAWSLLQLAVMLLALVMVTRAAPWPAAFTRRPRLAMVLLALAGFGTGLLFLEGQWDGVSVLGLAGAYVLWRRDRPGAAGFALGFTAAIAKPQLVIGIAAYMVGRRDWRAVGGALVGAAASIAIGLVGAGPHALVAFARRSRRRATPRRRRCRGRAACSGPSWVMRPGCSCWPSAPGSRRRVWRGGWQRGPPAPGPLRTVALRSGGAVAVRVATPAGT